jgi:hypothetical protein
MEPALDQNIVQEIKQQYDLDLLEGMHLLKSDIVDKIDQFPSDIYWLRWTYCIWSNRKLKMYIGALQILTLIILGWSAFWALIAAGFFIAIGNLTYRRRRKRMMRMICDYIGALRGNRPEEKWLELVMVTMWKMIPPVSWGVKNVDDWMNEKAESDE